MDTYNVRLKPNKSNSANIIGVGGANGRWNNSINELKGLCSVLIVMMHLKYNTGIEMNSYFYNRIVPSFAHLVFLFMVLSGYGMFEGYYEKIKNNAINLNDFYLRRIKKVAPFFAVLILLDIANERTWTSVAEGTMNLTFLYGLLPYNDLSSIGVAWTLGVIFVFYFMFPFFVFLLYNKRRAWIVFGLTIIMNFICNEHFFVYPFVVEGHFSPRKNILYCFCFFVMGGLLSLYSKELTRLRDKKTVRRISCAWIIIVLTLYIIFPDEIEISNNYIFIGKMLLLCGSISIYAILNNPAILNNRPVKFLSRFSMEVYLAHMVIFRILERLQVTYLLKKAFGNFKVLSFALIYITTIVGTLLFAYCFDWFYKKCLNCVTDRHREGADCN